MDDLQHKAPLAGFQGSRPPAPHWFEHALKQAPERKFIEVDGAKIDTLAWGRRGAPGLILLHGGMAHADWWSFIAPLLAGERRVVAPTFSGMGRSGWRDAYTFSQFAREACETGRAAGAFEAGPPVIVGHSFGARVAVVAAHEYHNEVASAVIVDPPFFAPENMREPNPPRPYKGHRPYETLDALVARFRLSPPQPCENAFILDHIARHSAREIVDGKGHKRWTLGFDPDFWDKTTRSDIVPMLQAALTPLALARGDKLETVQARRRPLFPEPAAAGRASPRPAGSRASCDDRPAARFRRHAADAVADLAAGALPLSRPGEGPRVRVE